MWSSRIKLFKRYLDMVSLSHHSLQVRLGSHPRVICFNMSRYTKSDPFNRPFTIQLLWARKTISPTFYSPIYPVDEGNEEVGLVWDNISLFFVWCESSSLLRLKNLGCDGSIPCVLYRLKPRSSEGDQNVSRVTLHEFDITFWLL